MTKGNPAICYYPFQKIIEKKIKKNMSLISASYIKTNQFQLE